MKPISRRIKLLLSLAAVFFLAVLLWLNGRETETKEENGILWKDGAAQLSAVWQLLTQEQREAGQEEYEARKEEPIRPADLMRLTELLYENGAVEDACLLVMEQTMARFREENGGEEDPVTPEQLAECYALYAEYSRRPEILCSADVFLLGERGAAAAAGNVATDRGTLTASVTVCAGNGAENSVNGGLYLCYGYGYHVILEGKTICRVLGYARESIVLHNAWVTAGRGGSITVFYGGVMTALPLEQPLSESLSEVVADVTLEGSYVSALAVKKDVITAKVLRTGTDCVELEGYGTLYFADHFKIYKLYEELSEEQTASILVGYTTTGFAMEGDKISAALITEPITATNIRVLIQNSSYGGYAHETLSVTSGLRFFVSDGAGNIQWREPGDVVELDREQVAAAGGRLYLGTEKESGTLTLLNVKRAAGAPSCRGSLEVAVLNGQMVVVNELSIEEYLYGVLPSEMPSSFGIEALKAQAVCARSYAYHQLLANRFHQYGAHVDDSIASQVYLNYGENEAATFAVKDTFGKILTKDGSCIKAYYFSCSYGYTSDAADVWGDMEREDYLRGGLQAKEEGEGFLQLSEEAAFAEFLQSRREWYDEESAWFRWSTVFAAGQEETLYRRLSARYREAPDCILTVQTDQEGNETVVSREIKALGTLQDIVVRRRADSGVITELLLVGSKASYLIRKEYNVRAVLAPTGTVQLADGTVTSNLSLLPSAYLRIEKQGEDYLFLGGGNGHGVGMSQYGARALAAQGASYAEILEHFYPGTELTYLYR